MKKLYKVFLVAIVFCVLTSTAFSAQKLIKQVQLEKDITGEGIVRVVFRLDESFSNILASSGEADLASGTGDVGILVHEEEAWSGWNQGIGILMINYNDGAPQIRGYNAGSGWNTELVYEVGLGETVALWFSLNVDGANSQHSLSAQKSDMLDEVTEVYADFNSRAPEKGVASDKASYVSALLNDKFAYDSTVVELLDVAIVEDIEPYFTAKSGVAKVNENSLSVFPSVADSYVNIRFTNEIKSARVISLSGKEVIAASSETQIDVSTLSSGIYIVEIKSDNDKVFHTKFVKR